VKDLLWKASTQALIRLCLCSPCVADPELAANDEDVSTIKPEARPGGMHGSCQFVSQSRLCVDHRTFGIIIESGCDVCAQSPNESF
jgi:hypothetical protein